MRWLAGLLAIGLFLVAGRADAHAIGLSNGEWTANGTVLDAKLTFARGELSDLGGAEVVAGVAVTASRIPCPGEVVAVETTENDGVAVRGKWSCPAAGSMRVEMPVLAALSRGHRHVARVGDVEHVLYRGQDFFEIEGAATATETSATAFFRMGIEHILTGYDHLVFLLGLVLARARVRSILAVVTAFTVAHSITLALASLGIWTPSPRIVEPAIALSIAYVGIENFFVKDASKRWRITFPFGLIHGFGFAGALQEVALPRAEVPGSLLSFNLGVEAGQLMALAVALPVVLALREESWFEERGVRLASGAVAVAGGVWFVSRVAFG